MINDCPSIGFYKINIEEPKHLLIKKTIIYKDKNINEKRN